ncbi:hypothetical protein [Paraferrimonas sedimenticola]|uniref:Uncharacterized protein n=1 Tax=Paraferrimonas sedimenticola TaxID=375674 RepID=A0AA37RQV8_9GAMM|nr:hypothetical protein [Paraferrimonas sedimenticola]GLP95150.1 hypothetical protein GCM10007895_04560 [Paraferrimonas sedimenticola]
MKRANKLFAGIWFLSLSAFADVPNSLQGEVALVETTDATLSIQNFSNNEIKVDIYGDLLVLPPASGVTYECLGYAYLELQLIGVEHDFFEVPCQSRVQIQESFSYNDSTGG